MFYVGDSHDKARSSPIVYCGQENNTAQSILGAYNKSQVYIGDADNKATLLDKARYQLIYELDGGKQGGNQRTSMVYGDYYTLGYKEVPIKEGYRFIGWKLINGEDCGWYCGNKCFPEIRWYHYGDITFIAQWEYITFNITYDLQGGIANGDLPTTYITDDNNTFTPCSISKLGYDFIGWSPENIPPKTEGDIHFIAQFKPHEYTIEYDLIKVIRKILITVKRNIAVQQLLLSLGINLQVGINLFLKAT